MKSARLSALLLAFSLAGCATPSGVAVPRIAEPAISAAYLPLSGRVHLGLDKAAGAAMVIEPGLAVTNDHNDNLVDPKSVLGFGSLSDLMFFRTARAASPQTAVPAVGESVTAYGQDVDSGLRIAHGVVCEIVHVPGYADSPYFVFVGNAGPGFSGGPVLDTEGRLLGITWAYLDEPKRKRRLIFAYDMKRVMAEYSLRKPKKYTPAGSDSSAPVTANCDQTPHNPAP